MGKAMKIVLVIVVLLAATFAILKLVETDYRVSRSTTISAPAAHVYNIVKDHKMRKKWSPWEQKDPNMKNDYSGDGGVGSKMSWTSDVPEVGHGSLTTQELKDNEYIKSELAFTKPFEMSSVIEWNFTEDGGTTTAEWICSGKIELLGAMFFDAEAQLGPDFEKGLEGLKKLSEETYSVPQPEPEPMMADSSMEMESDSTMVEESDMDM